MILITGASKGIGRYLMEKFQESGETVFGTYNTTLPDTKDALVLTKVDITNSLEVASWINEKAKSGEQLILINCAGTNYNSFAHKTDLKLWKHVIDVNLMGTFNSISAILPLMRERGYGRIINMSSIVAQKGIPGTSAYAASKAALWGMSKSIAAENATKGITINNLNLGYFDIGMISDVPKDFLKIIKKGIPTEKLGSPSNILEAIRFLISSDYTTGTSIDINAGLY